MSSLRTFCGALLAALLAASPALAWQPGASGAVSLQNGAIDVVGVDGGDSAAGTTRAANKQTIRQRRADDCTAQTDGVAGELCIDDFAGPFACVPSSGACDTAAEWKRLLGTVRVGTSVPSTCAVGDPLFFDADASAGQRLWLCRATDTWVPLDNPFGAEIDGADLANTLTLVAASVLDLATNDADLRIAITSTAPVNGGSLLIDSTTGELEWHDGTTAHALANYAKLTGRTGGQDILAAPTSDGSDDAALVVAGGGTKEDTRGAAIHLFGNEHAATGKILLIAGDVSGGDIRMYTANSGAGIFNIPDLMIERDGGVVIQGLATDYSLGFGGGSARTLGVDRHATSNTAGNSLTVTAGGATASATDKDGGSLILHGGTPTGQGKAYTIIRSPTRATETGTGDQSMVDRLVVGGKRTLTDNSATAVLNATVASGSMAAGAIHYAIEATNGTDYQVETGVARYTAVNKAGAITAQVTKQDSVQTVSTGTLGTTWSISTANPAVISVNADTSLTASTGYPRITFWVENLTDQAVAPQ